MIRLGLRGVLVTEVLLLNAAEVERLLDLAACIDAVAQGLAQAADPGTPPAIGVLAIHAALGGFHVKAAAAGGRFAAKLNANFPGNPARHGLPTIQGLVILADTADGRPLAVMDSGALTRIRTAAATGVAVRHLALATSETATVIGAGAQGFDQLRAVHAVRPLRRAFVADLDMTNAERLSTRATERLGIPVEAVRDAAEATRRSQVIVTCTTSRSPVLGADMVPPGALVAAVGADHPEKQELEPGLMARSVIVTDVTEQCAAFGDLHHAIVAGLAGPADVRAELGEVVAGRRPGRRDDAERIVFDSTGTPIEDVAAASVVFRRAVEAGVGQRFAFSI
jgi:alanine dehydrogenase